jgi:hypothetical protein
MKSQRFLLAALALAMATVAASPTQAAVMDPVGDFLATYTGPHNGDLDIVAAAAVFDGAALTLTTRADGTVGTTTGGFYAWGVNRGAGTPGALQGTSPAIGAWALHDAVVLLRPNLTGTVVLIGPGGSLTFTNLAPGSVTVAGDTIQGVLPIGLLPSQGFGAHDYTYAAWTRSAPGSNAFVADFAPDGATFQAVPEPATWLCLILGFAAIGGAVRRRPVAAVG